MAKAAVTRRVISHYRDIVSDDPHLGFMWPHACHVNTCYPNMYEQSKAWAAYHFSKRWKGRTGYNPKRLQRLVIASGDPEIAYLYARDVPGANLDKLSKVVVDAGNPSWMRKFAKIPNANARMLEAFAILADAMSL